MSYPSKADIISAVTNPQFIKDSYLQGATVQIGKTGRPIMYTGGFSMAFPLIKGNEKLAFRVWHIEIKEIKERYKQISNYLNKLNLHYFSDFAYVENGLLVNGQLLDTSRMKWVDGSLLKEYIADNLQINSKLQKLAEDFLRMANDLHTNSISHGDLQHGNILITKTGEVKLVDYDSICVPETEGQNDIVTGLKGYQHPSRFLSGKASVKADYFSELVIYLSILAIAENPALWEKYEVANTETLLFSPEDFNDWNSSKIRNDLNLLSPKIKSLLKILDDYLSKTDYLSLSPFSLYFQKPVIKKFKSDKEVVLDGVEATLSWEVENAQSLEINEGIGDVTNKTELKIKPLGNKTYILKAKSFFEETEKTIEIKVFPTPLIETIFVPAPIIRETINLQISIPKFPQVDISINNIQNGILLNEKKIHSSVPNFNLTPFDKVELVGEETKTTWSNVITPLLSRVSNINKWGFRKNKIS